jgi:hypothetical protein
MNKIAIMMILVLCLGIGVYCQETKAEESPSNTAEIDGVSSAPGLKFLQDGCIAIVCYTDAECTEYPLESNTCPKCRRPYHDAAYLTGFCGLP